MEDIDQFLKRESMPPERIHNWMDTQLSVARYYGSCTVNGHKYIVAMDEKDNPLVRIDIYEKENIEAKKDKFAMVKNYSEMKLDLLFGTE